MLPRENKKRSKNKYRYKTFLKS